MCSMFFKFYPEPEKITCRFVKKEWKKECALRVLMQGARKDNDRKKYRSYYKVMKA